MLVLLSPAKSLDYESPRATSKYSMPQFLEEAQELIKELRTYSEEGLQKLMKISPELAALNLERYQKFSRPFTEENARQAILTFDGDVYTDFRLSEYGDKEFEFLQRHVRILSGLYGLLRPLDLMQAYRLEMGTRLKTKRGKNLYEFWGEKIKKAVEEALEEQGDDIVLNLASDEYFKSVVEKELKARVLDVKFLDFNPKNGKYRPITFYLKRLRGTMTDYMVRHQLRDPEDLKGFNEQGYYFSDGESTAETFVFLRDEKP